MKKNELLSRLKADVCADTELLKHDDTIPISEHNRKTLLELLKLGSVPEEEVDITAVESLKSLLSGYLEQYMADKPQGHRWIIDASLYLTFIAERPMHPIDKVGIKTEVTGSKTVYRCPCKSHEQGDICSYCNCEFVEEK